MEETSFNFPWSAEYQGDSEIQDGKINDKRNGTKCSVQGMDDQQMPWETILEGEDIGNIEMQLLRDSWCLLKHLRLNDWVQHAVGAPSMAITVFQSYHDRLSLSLFCFLCRFPAKTEKYAAMAQSLPNRNCFLYMAVTHAVGCLKEGVCYDPLSLDTSFITRKMESLGNIKYGSLIAYESNKYTRPSIHTRAITAINPLQCTFQSLFTLALCLAGSQDALGAPAQLDSRDIVERAGPGNSENNPIKC
ncbi:hypothetical protein SI65_05064 [Aspergillus cristatus]|uniref:Uncharacterized protein n=1 Tax=Aspergillus cristatus TaxID=573508 RepID=A0A1E3BGR0_ASPCR|nr:hypothetical protein SI65_05064 [Aspergillus cristatus]